MKNVYKWLIGVFAILLIIGGFFLFTPVMQNTFGGYQVLSVSKASVINDNVLGQSWFVSVSTIPSSFAITGRVSASDVSAQAGQTPVSDFDIQISTDQFLKYAISDSGDVIYDYYITASSKFISLTSVPDCPVNNGNTAFSGIRRQVGIYKQDYCVYRVMNGKVGIVQGNPSIPSNISIVVSANGKSSQAVNILTDRLSSGDKNLVVDGKVLGRVYYSGDLINSAESRPELFQSYKPVNVAGVWYFTSMSAYNNYNTLNGVGLSAVRSSIDSCFLNVMSKGDYGSNIDSYTKGCIAPYHDAFSGLSKVSVSGLNEIKQDSASNIYATFTTDRLLAFPQLTFVLDVDWIGIKVLKGVPLVNSVVVSSDCTSGTHGVVSASVSNTGSGTGAFDVDLVCPSKISVLSSTFTDNFLVNSPKSMSFSYDINNIQTKTSETCQIVAKDKASGVSSSKSISLSCSPTQVCIPNTMKCQGENKVECNADGSDWAIVIGDSGCKSNFTCKIDSDCGSAIGVKCTAGVCSNSGATCDAKFFGLAKGSLGVKEDCGFFCQIGLAKPTPTNTCVYDYMPIILIGAFLLILTAILVFGFKKKGKGHGKKSSTNILRSKLFWKLVIFLALIVTTILLFKYIFWIIVGLVVLLILDATLLHSAIRKELLG